MDEGRTRRDRLESRLARAHRKNRPDVVAELEAELATPLFPDALRHVWDIWARLRRRKAPGMSGPSPVEWPDIDAFLRRAQRRLAPWEIELIEELDDVYLAKQSAEAVSLADKQREIKDGLHRMTKVVTVKREKGGDRDNA